MKLPTLTTLILAVVSALVAWRFGGAQGVGVIAGFLLAAGTSLALYGLQEKYARTRPRMVLPAFALAFLAHLALLLGGALTLRYVEIAAAQADWQCFAVSFVVTVVVYLIVTTPLAAQALKASPPATPSSSRTAL